MIQNLIENTDTSYAKLQDDAARLVKKWTKSGLLEGLSSKTEKGNMAMILENQIRRIIAEQSSTGTAAIGSNTYSAEQWAGVALPLVRKVFGELSTKEFVSVQPMNLPSGLVFYLDFKYGTNKTPFSSNDSMYGVLDGLDEDANGGLYGAGRFGYSINDATASFSAVTSSAASSSLNYEDGLTPSDFVEFAIPTSSLSGLDVEGVRAFQLISGTLGVAPETGANVTNYAKYTRLAGGNVVFVVKKSDLHAAVATNISGSIVYQKQPTDQSRGDFEDAPAGSISIPEINVDMKSEPIVAKTRKLKAQWTPEFSQDLNAYHNIDAEGELTGTISEFVSLEIDLEVLDMLIQGARTTERWSATSNRVWNANTGAWVTNNPGYYNTQGQWFQTLGTKMQKVSNKIHTKTLRGGANFAVISPNVATIIESIPGYASDSNGDKMDFAMGVQKAGTMNSRFRIYKNPYMREDTILMGFRGSQFLETGAVYAPYIPLMMTPLIYDPETFTPRKGMMTRYAKKMIRGEYFAKIFVSDVNNAV